MLDFSDVTQEIRDLADLCVESSNIDVSLYEKYDVKRGLRDLNGQGVLVGLTEVSEIQSFVTVDGKRVPCDGELYYRGQNVEKLVEGFIKERRFGFEETTYLLLFGKLPTKTQLEHFRELLVSYRTLPTNFTRDVIMKAPSSDMMNTLARSVLTLYAYDENAEDTSIPNVLRQCIMLISVFPMLAVYGYQAYNHYICGDSFYIHNPLPQLSTAENILRMLRPDTKYTPLEAMVLDIALVLHMEHGGGNNSTFTTHVLSSSGTDTYSTVAAALGSLKGPKHGGANIKVVEMFEDLRAHITDINDEDQIRAYLIKLLDREAFDKKGLIYGMGHAIYSISDPRARVFKGFVERLAIAKGREDDFKLYSTVERLAKQVIAEKRHIYKGVSANVDFYSGFVYSMLDLPTKLFTPMFAVARIVGWSAHRIEELINVDKIIRPAYQCVQERMPYVPLEERV